MPLTGPTSCEQCPSCHQIKDFEQIVLDSDTKQLVRMRQLVTTRIALWVAGIALYLVVSIGALEMWSHLFRWACR